MRDWLDKAKPTQQEIDPPQPSESEVGKNVRNIDESDEFSAAINIFLGVANDEESQPSRVVKSEALPTISRHRAPLIVGKMPCEFCTPIRPLGRHFAHPTWL